MSDNLTHIPLPRNEWVDLYALSGITVGQPLIVENVGVCDIYVAVQAAQPPKDHDAYNILKRDDDIRLTNTLGDAGAWAFCNTSKGLIGVAEREGFQPLLKSATHDGYGNPIGSYRGAIDVHFAEVHNEVVNQLFNKHIGPSTTLTAVSAVGAIQVQVVNAAIFIVGDVVEIHNGNTETTFPIITSLPGGNIVVFDRPLDFAYAIGDDVDLLHTDLSTVAGTLAAPEIHEIKPPAGQIWYINRIILTMTHSIAADDGKFGGIAALTNGVILRATVSGQTGTFTNWKTNEDIRLDMFDVVYNDKAGGPGGNGTSGRGSFSRIGVIVPLNGDNGDFMDILIQDSLVGLDSFFINGQGYIERT